MREPLAKAMLLTGVLLGAALLAHNYLHKGAGCDEHRCWGADGSTTVSEGPGFDDVTFNPLLPGKNEGELHTYQSYNFVWHDGCWWKMGTSEHVCQRAVSAREN